MCFYAATYYACGDWKWGNMKERCFKQHRIGEVCGHKLVDSENTAHVRDDCRLCQDIRIKRGRLEKEEGNIRRWRAEGSKFEMSIAKAQRQARELIETIRDMESRRMKNVHAIGLKQGGDSGGAGKSTVEQRASSRTDIVRRSTCPISRRLWWRPCT